MGVKTKRVERTAPEVNRKGLLRHISDAIQIREMVSFSAFEGACSYPKYEAYNWERNSVVLFTALFVVQRRFNV